MRTAARCEQAYLGVACCKLARARTKGEIKIAAYLDAQLTCGNNFERCEPTCFLVHVTEHDSEHAKVKVLYYLASDPLPKTNTFTVTCARVIGRIAPIRVAPPRHTATALQSGSGGSVPIALPLCYLPTFCAIAAYADRSIHVFAFFR